MSLAQEVKQCASAIRVELQKDINTARVLATQTVMELNSAHRQAAMEKWIAVGLISAVGLVAFAFWAGTFVR